MTVLVLAATSNMLMAMRVFYGNHGGTAMVEKVEKEIYGGSSGMEKKTL